VPSATPARLAIALTGELKYPRSAITSTAASRMRWYFSLPGPAVAIFVESGLVVLILRFSPGLTPEVSGAVTLMNQTGFAKNEL
jgi:hypothetical protein